MKVLRSQTGVAMVTVLFIGAALTAVVSVAAFATVKELRASTDDRRSAQALSFAEAGVDRMLNYVRSGRVNWNMISLAGCTAATSPDGVNHPALGLPGGASGSVGTGSYSVRLEVFNPFASTPATRFAPGACQPASVPPGYQRYYLSPKTPSGAPQYFAITSTGASATNPTPCPASVGGGCRVVRQVLQVKGLGLPVGIYAKESIDSNGNPTMNDISMITPGSITGREKLTFNGYDRYYSLADFGWTTMTNATTTPVPAAVHALGTISLKNVIQQQGFEHPPNPNCSANLRAGTRPGQSAWDQSGGGGQTPANTPPCAGWVAAGGTPAGPPPTSKISDLSAVAPKPDLSPEDFLVLKDSAQTDGVYCGMTGPTFVGATCTRRGAPWTTNNPIPSGLITDLGISSTNPALPGVFIAYFEFPNPPLTSSSNLVTWKAGWGPCNTDPNLNKQVILIIRNGNLKISAGTQIHGALIVPDGDVDDSGGSDIDGTVIAKTFTQRGNQTFSMSSCALRSLPGPYLDFTPFAWTEVDR
jgi:hypothetical protein